MASFTRLLSQIFGVLWSGRVWLETIYLLLAFPLGLAYFVLLSVGWSLGLATLLIWVGVLILALTLLLSRAAVSLERGLSASLLGTPLPAITATDTTAGPWRRLYANAIHPVTFKGMLFMLLKFPLGVVGFVTIVTGLAISVAMIAAPIAGLFGVTVDDVYVSLRPGWAVAWSVAGVLVLTAVLHLFRALAALHRLLAKSLLVYGDEPTPASAGS